jgi:aspartate racemase
MHIGLIGGIGPAATDLYYRSLTEACKAAGTPLELTIAHADAPTLRVNLTAGNAAAQAAIFGRLARRLADAGAGCVAVTSVAGHFCMDAFRELSPLPVIDMRESVPRRLREGGWRTLGILGTRQAMTSAMYGYLSEFAMLVPQAAAIEPVHDAYVETALSGRITEPNRRIFFDAGRDMTARGAEAILLAGTDLFVAFEGQEPGFRTIDSALLHVADIALESAR